MQTRNVYKIIPAEDWQRACTTGHYKGSNDDKRDGSIHLSAPDQIAGTLKKHFFQQTGLLLVNFRSEDLLPKLKWEPSRDGALFPHHYGALPTQLATHAVPTGLDACGTHHVPELIE